MGGKTITSIPIPRLGRLDSQNGLKPQGHSLFILWARETKYGLTHKLLPLLEDIYISLLSEERV